MNEDLEEKIKAGFFRRLKDRVLSENTLYMSPIGLPYFLIKDMYRLRRARNLCSNFKQFVSGLREGEKAEYPKAIQFFEGMSPKRMKRFFFDYISTFGLVSTPEPMLQFVQNRPY